MNLRTIAAAGLGTAMLLAALIVGSTGRAHQAATPGATPSAFECDIAPRSEDDLADLSERAATPSSDAGTPSVDDADLAAGTPVDELTLAGVESTLARIAACEAAGDLPRLFALYTDEYVVRAVLPTEPVAIVPGTPIAPPSTGSPEGGSSVWTVLDAVNLPDGRVVMTLDRSGRLERVVFVDIGALWLVDDVVRITDNGGTPVADVSDDLLALPPVQAAIAAAAEFADVSPADVTVVSVEPTVWSDSSLGCPQPDEFHAQAEVPGYLVSLRVGDADVAYHTDNAHTVIPCEVAGSV